MEEGRNLTRQTQPAAANRSLAKSLLAPRDAGRLALVPTGKGHGTMTGTVAKGPAGIAGIVVVKPWGLTGTLANLGCIHADDGQVIRFWLSGATAKQTHRQNNQHQAQQVGDTSQELTLPGRAGYRARILKFQPTFFHALIP